MPNSRLAPLKRYKFETFMSLSRKSYVMTEFIVLVKFILNDLLNGMKFGQENCAWLATGKTKKLNLKEISFKL